MATASVSATVVAQFCIRHIFKQEKKKQIGWINNTVNTYSLSDNWLGYK